MNSDIIDIKNKMNENRTSLFKRKLYLLSEDKKNYPKINKSVKLLENEIKPASQTKSK